MSYTNVTLLEFVERELGQPLPSEERELLESCKEEIKFIRMMDTVKNEMARLSVPIGQLILAVNASGSLTTLHRERTTGHQYKCVVRPLKQPDTTKIVVVTNLDTSKKTGAGVWVWNFIDA